MRLQTALFRGFGGCCFFTFVRLLIFEVLHQWCCGYFLSLCRWPSIFFLGRYWVGQRLKKVHEFRIEIDCPLACIGATFSARNAGVGCVFEGGWTKETWVCECLCRVFKSKLADVVGQLG